MFNLPSKWAQAAAAATLTAGVAVTAPAQTATTAPPVDNSGLFNTYSISHTSGQDTVTWSTCGALEESTGCYGSNTMGPFNRVCAIMEDQPVRDVNTVTRRIFVLDSGKTNPATKKNPNVSLSVYTMTDQLTINYDRVTVALTQKLNLPVTGGNKAVCSMAGNDLSLYIGTDQSDNATRVNMKSRKLETLPGFSPPLPVTDISADDRGYVSVSQGIPPFIGGFTIYDPKDQLAQEGGGTAFTLNGRNAFRP